MTSRTLTLQMDFHKSLATPKVSSQDWYYSKKPRTNLLGIYCANDDTINCFIYDETTGGVGPNEAISLLDYLLTDLENRIGGHDQLIIWCDNSPAHFNECYLFFYMDDLVKKGKLLRADLKFLLEGHSYSICDRRFGSIQRLFDTHEVIEFPHQWAIVLERSHLKDVRTYWVALNMIKDYKSFLKMQYISRNEDLDGEKFEVRGIAWLNFGYGELLNENGELKLVHHPESVFLRFRMDPKEQPRRVSFIKKRQVTKLTPELLTPFSQEARPVKKSVKDFCVKLSQKYLAENAVHFYQSLRVVDDDSDTD